MSVVGGGAPPPPRARRAFGWAAAIALAAPFALAALACGREAPPPATAATAAAVGAPRMVDDDYPGALAKAKASGKLLFVDAWAPWCHSCLSMRAYVLGDPSLARLDGAYVFASVDTERDDNRAFVERFPNHAWPTLWVIDPTTEKPLLAWAGTTTAEELGLLLEDARHAKDDPQLAGFFRAASAAHGGDAKTAVAEYRAILAAASPRLRPRVVEGLTNALSDAGEHLECLELARAEAPRLPRGASLATVVATGLSCAGELPAPAGDDLATLAETRVATDEALVTDDRSGVYEALVELADKRKDDARKRRVASAWAASLEASAAKATTPAARAVFDPHRVEAYVALGDPARAIPMLEASARDFPRDYNPPAHLARVHHEMKRDDLAEPAIARALALVYGPRALRIAALGADIAEARGDRATAAARLRDALARTESMPLSRGQKKARAKLAERLQKP